jgi:hypothetical protein
MKGALVFRPSGVSVSPSNASFLVAALFFLSSVLPASNQQTQGKINPYLRWAILGSSTGLWAVHEDGSGLVQLTPDPIAQFSVSPNGAMVAYVTSSDPDNLDFHIPIGFSLKLLSLFTGKIITISSLDSPGIRRTSPPEAQFSAYQALLALKKGALIWSPGNSYLAYTSASQGNSGDLYIYVISSAETRRLTTFQFSHGPAFAYHLSFAATGAKLYYSAAYEFGENGPNWMVGAWVTDLLGKQIQVGGADYSEENLDSWVSTNELLLSSWNSDCGKQNMRIVNASTGQTRQVWKGCYQDMLYDRSLGEILITVTPEMALTNSYKQPGVWLSSIWTPTPRKLSDQGYKKLYRGDRSAAWFAYSQEEGLVSLQRSGKSTSILNDDQYAFISSLDLQPVFHKANETTWLWSGEGLYAAIPGQNLVQIYPVTPMRVWTTPVQNDLYLFSVQDGENLRIYAFRKNDLKPNLVDIRVNGLNSLDWNK